VTRDSSLRYDRLDKETFAPDVVLIVDTESGLVFREDGVLWAAYLSRGRHKQSLKTYRMIG